MMSRRITCPVCGFKTTATRYEAEGCWSCNQDREQREEEKAFEEFMELDETTRWYTLWVAAGRPT